MTLIPSSWQSVMKSINDYKEIYTTGDAKEVGNLMSVVWGAWDVAMAI